MHVAVTSREPKEGPQKHWYPVCSQKNERSNEICILYMHIDLFNNIRLRVGALGQGTMHVAVTSREPKEGPQKHWYPV